MNFYLWIRESVKRAVLMGVTDAMEHIGTPIDGDEHSDKLLTSLREKSSAMILEARSVEPISQPTSAPGTRKRLGKSLEQIQAPQVRPAA